MLGAKRLVGETPSARRWAVATANLTVRCRIAAAPELEELFGITQFPFSEADVTIELRGVPTAVVNSLRRAVTDEILGYALQVPEGGFQAERTTELFMLPQFVNQRIELMVLHQSAAAKAAALGVKFELNVANASAVPLTVYAGDLRVAAGNLTAPIFNPTYELATLQPGRTLVVIDIGIAAGRGRDHAMYQVACRGAFRHLDLPQHTEDEMRLETGVAADNSGYRISSLVADPRSHELRLTLGAVTERSAEQDAKAALVAACENICARLRLVLGAIDGAGGAGLPAAVGAMQYTTVALESGLTEATLSAPGETHTIGELLRRAVYDTGDVSYAAYAVSSHEKRLTLTVRLAGDVTATIIEATQMAIRTFDIIRHSLT